VSEDPWMELDRGRLAVLVAAGRARRREACSAYKMHSAGRSFRLAFGYAEWVSEVVWIASPAHGLLDPWDEVEPYEYCFWMMRLWDLEAWAERVAEALGEALPRRVRALLVLASGRVPEALAWAVDRVGVPAETYCPLDGLDRGRVAEWFERRLPRCRVCRQVVERPADDLHAVYCGGEVAHRACAEGRVLDCWRCAE